MRRIILKGCIAKMQSFSWRTVFTAWRQHSHDKGSRRSRAESAMLAILRLRKQHILRAWLAVHQGVQHKRALLRKAVAFLCHAVLPVTFQAWHSYSHSQSNRRFRAESALLSMQQHRKQVVRGALREVHLEALHKRGRLSRALAHMRQAVLPAAFHAWAANAAWQADARHKILRCPQVRIVTSVIRPYCVPRFQGCQQEHHKFAMLAAP